MYRLLAETAMVVHFAFLVHLAAGGFLAWRWRHAGERGLPPPPFIDHYIEGVIHPEQYTNLARSGVAVLVLFSYAGYVLRRR
ncbi:hypothetical protein [Nonomuraea sp. NPDC050783]|uniref:hypothetical protein n=1 Tax=Nonomuraea sp. NPDC050783 TaxID=3154634 RepID=UPI0034664C14